MKGVFSNAVPVFFFFKSKKPKMLIWFIGLKEFLKLSYRTGIVNYKVHEFKCQSESGFQVALKFSRLPTKSYKLQFFFC